MKRITALLFASLMLMTVVAADETVARNIYMYRDADHSWHGIVYEARVTDDNELGLWLLGQKMYPNYCPGGDWDLVLYEGTNEIYRAVDKISPSYYYGSFQGWVYANLDADDYSNVKVRYECPENPTWDISAANTFDFTIEEEQTPIYTPPTNYCSWWSRWRGWC